MRLALFAATAILTASAAVAGNETAGEAKQADATSNVLLTQPLEGMEGKAVSVVEEDIPPGFQTPRHSHPANVVVYVLEGAIELQLEGEGTLAASAGEVIYEAPDHPMVGRNVSSEEGARILVFHVGDEGAPLTELQE